MELDRGEESQREGLLKLVAALKEPDAAKQAALLSAVVDVDAHLRFVAMENILYHWDGYSFNRNNYRIYENPETRRFHFILHGMDQVFGDAGQSLQRAPGASVGSILWRTPANQARYIELLLETYEKTRGVVPIPSASGKGAGLRISGGSRQGQKMLKGDSPWETLSYEINSTGSDSVLVVELRASAGEMWIDRETLRVIRVP